MMRHPLSLRAQQQALARAIVGDEPDALVDIHHWLQRRPTGAPALIGAYRHAHTARLLAALRDNFEVLAQAMGDEGFDALGRAYLRAHPPRRPSIRWLGEHLAEFMDQAGDDLVPHAALADLARMDWALRGAFDAADGPTVDEAALAAIEASRWPDLRLRLHPSVALLALRWQVEPAWRALNLADADAPPALPEPQARPHHLLVWRDGMATQWRSLGEHEAALLQAALAGEAFAALCERSAAQLDDAEAAVPQLVQTLRQWLAEGLVSACLT